MNIKKLSVSFVIAAAAAVAAAVSVCACTGVYVGKDVSSDGSVMLMRTEDMESGENKRFIVHPAADHAEGDMFKDAWGLTVPMPEHTYRYSAVPNSAYRGIGSAPYGGAGFNEKGLAATATITAYPNEKVIAADPYVKNGLHEISITDLILSRAATPREGVELIADIVDKYGNGEGSIIMLADRNEAWYMELYTGHTYAAIKLPDDKAAVIPNAFMLGNVDVMSEDVIVSRDVAELAGKNGNRINLRNTYAEPAKDTNTIRIWGGKKLLHGIAATNPYDTKYELFFEPSQKINIKDVMNVTRYRYEGTKYDVNLPENKYIRPIGTVRQEECHILQIYPQLDIESGSIEWLCLGNSEFTSYVPYFAVPLTDTPPIFRYDSLEYSPYSMYWASRGLSALCGQNRALYGNKVREFFDKYENKLIAANAGKIKEMQEAQDKTQFANKTCYEYSYDLYNKTLDIHKELLTFLTIYEGKDEYKNNTFTFEPKVSAEICDNASMTKYPYIIQSE